MPHFTIAGLAPKDRHGRLVDLNDRQPFPAFGTEGTAIGNDVDFEYNPIGFHDFLDKELAVDQHPDSGFGGGGFAQAGRDRSSRIVLGYVEFRDEESVEKAIGLTGQKLLGIPVIVQLTEAEKNRIAKAEGPATQSNGIPFHRLYVGNILFSRK